MRVRIRLRRGVVQVRMQVSAPEMPVLVEMKLAAAREFAERVEAERNQHQRHTELQGQRQSFADLDVQDDDDHSGHEQRDRVAVAS